MTPMKRRSFLAAAGALALPLPAFAQAIPKRKLDRIAISSSTYRGNYDGRFSVAGAMPRLSHTNLAAYVKQQFGVTRIELWDAQFGPTGPTVERCREIKAATDAAGCAIVSVEVEDVPNLGQTDPAKQAEALTALRAWLDKGKILGAGSIRINVSRGTDPVNLPVAIDSLKQGAKYGRSIGVRVLVENHGGYTSNIPDMIALVSAVNDDFVRIEPDWGAWTPEMAGAPDRYAAMQAAMPLTHIVSAKGTVFDETTYEHTAFDIARLVKAAEAGGFKGVYSIELYNTPAPKDTDRAVRSFIKTITDNMR